MSLRKFQQMRNQEVGQAVSEYRRSLRDAGKADAAVAKAVSYDADEQFFALARDIEKALPTAAPLQSQVGAAYAYFGKPQEAEAAYLRSLKASPNPDVQDLLAVLYMREGRADEAAPLVRHVIEQRQRDKIGYVYLLVEAYQAAGQHDQALSVLQQVEAAFPGIASNAEFAKYRTNSLKRRHSNKRIASKNLAPVAVRAAQRRPIGVLIAKLIGPAVALAALVIYLGVAYERGQSRQVWLVNGLDRAYDVAVNGRRVHLPAGGHAAASLAEGDVNVAPGPADVPHRYVVLVAAVQARDIRDQSRQDGARL
jgi:tetratricopeptide (TPR) repeat protein